MPFFVYDAAVSGEGVDDLSGNRVYYVAWHVDIEGFRTRIPSDLDPLGRAGVGYVQLGNDITSSGVLSGDAWQDPMWLNSVQGQKIAEPQDLGGSFGRIVASRIHWALSPGTTVHLLLLGDSV